MQILEREKVDNRKERRRHLIYYLPAIDASNEHCIGHVYDITTKGMMLIGDDAIDVGRTIALRVKQPHGLTSSEHFFVEATCCWSRKDEHSNHYLVGFKFSKIDRSQTITINSLIARFGFTD